MNKIRIDIDRRMNWTFWVTKGKKKQTSYHRFQMESVGRNGSHFGWFLYLRFDACDYPIQRGHNYAVEPNEFRKYDRDRWWKIPSSSCNHLSSMAANKPFCVLFLSISIKRRIFLKSFFLSTSALTWISSRLTKTIEHWNQMVSQMVRRRCTICTAGKTDWQLDIVSPAFVYTQYGMAFN